MTARAGAALSHVLVRVDRIAFFQLIRRREFFDPAGSGFVESEGGNSFCRRMHGVMSHPQGTPDSAWPSNVRIT